MGKNQVFSAQVNIEALAQILHGHDRALDVPAGAARSDAGLPLRLAGLGGLPQGEIAGVVFFVFIHIHSGAVFHSGEVFFRKLAVLGKFGDPKIVGAIIGAIGVTFFVQGRDEVGHLADVVGGVGQYLGLLQVQDSRILQKSLLIFLRVGAYIHVLAGGIAD